MPPVAALGTIEYGDPATVATAGAPVLAMVILPIVSPFCKPADVNKVEPAPVVKTVPYTLVPLFAVIVKVGAVTVNVPLA